MTKLAKLLRPVLQPLWALAALLPLAAGAQAPYPDRPIRILTPYEPGSLVDSTTRLVAEGLRAELGQNVTVENRTGGMGMYITRVGMVCSHHYFRPAILILNSAAGTY